MENGLATTPDKTKEITTKLESVEKMSLLLLRKKWKVDGLFYNLIKLGWKFAFNNAKKAIGTCSISKKTIYISKYFIDCNDDFPLWEDTVKHEIAHAIDFEIRGTSDHSYIWKSIATQIGCAPERTYKDGTLTIGKTKYVLKCDNCGFEKSIHRKRKKSVACTSCCNNHNSGNYTNKFQLSLISNY